MSESLGLFLATVGCGVALTVLAIRVLAVRSGTRSQVPSKSGPAFVDDASGGISLAVADSFLTQFGRCYARLHAGNPGADGECGVVPGIGSEPVGFGPSETRESFRLRSNADPVHWDLSKLFDPSFPDQDMTITHVSLWDAAAGGRFLQAIELDHPFVYSLRWRAIFGSMWVEIPRGDLVIRVGPLEEDQFRAGQDGADTSRSAAAMG